jgi:hypothetical protein
VAFFDGVVEVGELFWAFFLVKLTMVNHFLKDALEWFKNMLWKVSFLIILKDYAIRYLKML